MSEERKYEGYTAPEQEQTAYSSPEYGQAADRVPQYEQPYQQPVVAKTGFATAALVFGILAFLTTLVLVNYVFGALAILFAIIYLVKKADVKPKGKAITGLVLAVISLAVSTTIWVSAYMYVVNTEISDIVEDAATLMGEEVDGREMMNEIIMESTGNAVDLEMVEDFVGGEVSIERVMNFMDGVSEEEIYAFAEKVENMDFSGLADDFPDGVTYEALEEKIGENFTLRDLMEYLEANGVVIEGDVDADMEGIQAAPLN